MIKINKVFGFKTNTLYLAELVIQRKEYTADDVKVISESFNPKKFALVRNMFIGYNDIFTQSYYSILGETNREGEVVVTNLSPLVTINKRLSYNDAVKMLEDANKTKFKQKVKK